MSTVLLVLLALPLIGAVIVAILGSQRLAMIRWASLGVALLCLILSIILAIGFHHQRSEPSYAEEHAQAKTNPTFLPEFVPGAHAEDRHKTTWSLFSLQTGDSTSQGGDIQFYLGIDGINLWLIVLTTVLMVPCVLISWEQVTERAHEFYAWLLFLQTTMLGIFMAFDIVLFYVFFELSLVPLFFLIGIWGGPERKRAARKFLIFTLTGSLITLLGIIGVVLACFFHTQTAESPGVLTFSIPELIRIVHEGIASTNSSVNWGAVQLWVFLALTAGLAIKVPFVPVHTWLPLAHVEAPTAGSVDLAGVLLKVGAYGFLRLCIPLAPEASYSLGLPLLSTLAVIGIIYGALCAYAQSDIKKLIAYSSVSHLGMCMLGMFALNEVGMAGSMMVMINHGLSTAALFLLVGMIYERYHTRKMEDYGGMSRRLPLLGAFMVFICLTSVGLPGLNGFIGEVLVLFGVMDQQVSNNQFPYYAVLGSLGIVLGAWYLFTMLRKVFFGEVKEPELHGEHEPVRDMKPREAWAIVPIAVLCLVIGLYPQPLLKSIKPDIAILSNITDNARKAAQQDNETELTMKAVRAEGLGLKAR